MYADHIHSYAYALCLVHLQLSTLVHFLCADTLDWALPLQHSSLAVGAFSLVRELVFPLLAAAHSGLSRLREGLILALPPSQQERLNASRGAHTRGRGGRTPMPLPSARPSDDMQPTAAMVACLLQAAFWCLRVAAPQLAAAFPLPLHRATSLQALWVELGHCVAALSHFQSLFVTVRLTGPGHEVRQKNYRRQRVMAAVGWLAEHMQQPLYHWPTATLLQSLLSHQPDVLRVVELDGVTELLPGWGGSWWVD